MRIKAAIPVAAVLLLASQAIAAPDDRRPPAPDWITATNQPCKIWNPEPQPNESVTWSGDCKDGYASGEGTLRWTENGKPDAEFTGRYANGKRNGHGVIVTPDGKRAEGEWLNDMPLVGDRNAI